MKRSLLVLLVLAMLAVIVAGCGEETATTTSAGGGTETTAATTAGVAKSVLVNPQGYPADPAATPEAGGTMKMILGMTLGNFGAPWDHMPGPNAYVCRAVNEGLVAIGPDGTRAAAVGDRVEDGRRGQDLHVHLEGGREVPGWDRLQR